jgi:hypothetical protein
VLPHAIAGRRAFENAMTLLLEPSRETTVASSSILIKRTGMPLLNVPNRAAFPRVYL